MARVVAGVVGDGTGECRSSCTLTPALSQRARETGNVVGDALCAFADGAVVDGARADGIHFAAAAAGTERNDGPEGVV